MKIEYKKNSCDFSSKKYKTKVDRWEITSSGKKGFEINSNLNRKILEWKSNYEKENDIKEMPFESIDKKWK